jgi:LmbE family N-acetylglucosaminyl deacetylase
MVGIMRRFRPHAVVTYDPFGATGHPDHIQAHRVTLLAVEAATEPHAFPDQGMLWTVNQVFYPVFPISAMERFIAEDLRAGRAHPFDGRSSVEINYTRSDETVTHQVDIREVYERKREALHAHRTQVGPHYPLLPRAALARREHEHFRLAFDRSADADFGDIFEPSTRDCA